MVIIVGMELTKNQNYFVTGARKQIDRKKKPYFHHITLANHVSLSCFSNLKTELDLLGNQPDRIGSPRPPQQKSSES